MIPPSRFRVTKRVLLDATGLAGAAAVVKGVPKICPPAALIVAGAFALAFAWFMARSVVQAGAGKP